MEEETRKLFDPSGCLRMVATNVEEERRKAFTLCLKSSEMAYNLMRNVGVRPFPGPAPPLVLAPLSPPPPLSGLQPVCVGHQDALGAL